MSRSDVADAHELAVQALFRMAQDTLLSAAVIEQGRASWVLPAAL